MASSLSKIKTLVSSSSRDLLKLAFSSAVWASTLDLRSAFSFNYRSAVSSVCNLDLLKSSSAIILDAATSASTLDLLRAFSNYRAERYLYNIEGYR